MSDELLQSPITIERLCSGDETAFELVFRTCYGRVFGAAYRLLGNRAEAEEVAQEAFVRLHRRPPSASASTNLLGWLVTVATNLSFNRLRAERRRLQREDKARLPDAGVATDAYHAERADAVADVRSVLAGLPERQALILLLRHSGLSYAEVAERLAVSPNSVGTLLARAERAFRQAYEQHQKGGTDERRP